VKLKKVGQAPSRYQSDAQSPMQSCRSLQPI